MEWLALVEPDVEADWGDLRCGASRAGSRRACGRSSRRRRWVEGGRVGRVVAQVVPALWAEHHAAGGALLVEASATAVPLPPAMRS